MAIGDVLSGRFHQKCMCVLFNIYFKSIEVSVLLFPLSQYFIFHMLNFKMVTLKINTPFYIVECTHHHTHYTAEKNLTCD